MILWVNLLPWRAEKMRRTRQYLIGTLILALLLSSFVLVLGDWMLTQYRQQLVTQQSRWHQFIDQAQILCNRQQITAQRWQSIVEKKQRWQIHQMQWQLWLQLAKWLDQNTPEKIWLTQLKKSDTELLIAGISAAPDEIHFLRRALSQLSLFQQIVHGEIRRQTSGEFHFTLRAILRQEKSQ